MNKTLPRLLLAGLVLGLLVLCGYWLLFTQFMVYDDEGYVLWSLHHYFTDGGLYTRVYSQYGPFLYALYHAVHTLGGVAFDNETGRLLTLGYWCGAAALGGGFVWSQTRSLIAALGATILTFGGLLIMINEPIHPGGLLAFLSAVGAVGGAAALSRGRPRTFAVLCGGVGAAMLLTKVNVGAFFLVAAGSWMAVNLTFPRLGRASIWLTAVGSLLLPLWLMHSLWPASWIATFCLTFSCGALALVVLAAKERRAWFGSAAWGWFAGATGLVAGLTLISVWLRGTSWAMLWHGVVIAPLRQPMVYANPVSWPAMVPALSLGMIALALLHHSGRWAGSTRLIALFRVAAFGWFLLETPHAIDNRLVFFSFWYGPALVWLMIVPLTSSEGVAPPRPRTWVAWVFIWQVLHAYPVAGSQMGWGAFLWIPLAVAGGYEALQLWADALRERARLIRWSGGVAFAAGAAVMLGVFVRASSQRYLGETPLGLPGASDLRLEDDMTTAYRILDKNVRLHGDELFSYPGMFSFNIWTHRPTPTAANVTHWFSLLNDAQQQAIITQLEQDARPVLIVQRYLINYLVYHGYAPRGPLQNFLTTHFAPLFRIDSFEFWVRQGRQAAAVSTARIGPTDTTNTDMLVLTTDAPGPIAAIEIRGLFPPHHLVARLAPDDVHPWEVQPLNADNSVWGAAGSAPPPRLKRISTKLYLGNRQLPPLDLLKVVLLDSTGRVVDTLRFTK